MGISSTLLVFALLGYTPPFGGMVAEDVASGLAFAALTDHRLSKYNPLRGISDDLNAYG